MAFRGRGRFGGGGGEFRNVKQESFVLFPDNKLPEKRAITEEDKMMLQYSRSLSNHFKSSPYFLGDCLSENKEENFDIEKAFDLNKKRTGSSEESLLSYGYILLQAGNFPAELIRGNKQRIRKKVRWTIKKDLKKLDILEQLEENDKDKDSISKKENEEEEEDDEEEHEDEEEDSDDGDYGMAEICDDDEDDYNMDDDGEEEAVM